MKTDVVALLRKLKTGLPSVVIVDGGTVTRFQLEEACTAVTELTRVAKLALESDGGTRYENDEDDCGSHACCGTVSYREHAVDCWVPLLRAALARMQTEQRE